MTTAAPIAIVRRLAAIALLLCLLALLVGCGRNSIVGKWQGKVPFGTMTLPMTIEFKSDGTDTRTFSSLIGATVLSDAYVVKDDKIEITPTGMSIDGRSVPVPALVSGPTTASYKVDGDTLALTMPGQPQTVMLTRVKS